MVVSLLRRLHGGGGGVRDIDLSIASGETLAVLGPSGAGKSTLVKVIAGIDRAQKGSVHIEGVDVTRLTPGRRNVGVVFQDHPLYEHLSVKANVALATSGLKLARDERNGRVEDALEACDLRSLASRQAARLSGGERARTSIARVLARRPAVVLFDEPFASVDRIFRPPLRALVVDQLKTLGAATLHVTHSLSEATAVSDRVAILIEGTIRQTGPLDLIRQNPADSRVAEFLHQEGEDQ